MNKMTRHITRLATTIALMAIALNGNAQTAITDDFSWHGSSSIWAGWSLGDGHLYHHNYGDNSVGYQAQQPCNDTPIQVDGTTYPTYNTASPENYYHFKIGQGKKGNIKVYYRDAQAISRANVRYENVTLSNTTSNAYTDITYTLPRTDLHFDKVTVNVTSTNNVRVIVRYVESKNYGDDGFVEADEWDCSPTYNGTNTIEVTPSASRNPNWHIQSISIGTTSQAADISDVSMNIETHYDTSGITASELREATNGSALSPASTETLADGVTRVKTYNFDLSSASADKDYYIYGGMFGGLAVTMEAAPDDLLTITEDHAWHGSNTTTIGAWHTFDDQYLSRFGGSMAPDNGTTITYQGASYPTYNNVNTGGAIQMNVGEGRGEIRVYYREGQQYSTNRTINFDTSAASPDNANTVHINGNYVQFDNGWTGYSYTSGLGWSSTVMPDDYSITLNNCNAEVRVVVRYVEQQSDSDEDTSEYTTNNGSTQTLTVHRRDGHENWHVRSIYIQNRTAGNITVASSTLTGREMQGQTVPTLMLDQTTTVSGATTSDGDNGTKVLTYEFDHTSATDYYISGGMIGAIEVEFESVTAPNLSPITTDYLFYYNGGDGLGNGNDGYNWGTPTQYRYSEYPASETWRIARSDTKVYVNYNAAAGTDGDRDPAREGSYRLTTTDAIGFKLSKDKNYRVRVFANTNAPTVLYQGDIVKQSTAVQGTTTTLMLEDDNDGLRPSGTTLYTYEISGDGVNDQTFWVRNPNNQIDLGGFEVLPIDNTSTDMSGKTTYSSPTSWEVDDCDTTQGNELRTSDLYDLLKGGNANSNVYVYGPTMPINGYEVNGHRTVMLNEGNRVYFKVPAGYKVHFTYAGDANVPVVLNHNGTELRAQNSNAGFNTVTYPAADGEYTTGEETIYISGGSQDYVYFYGFTLDKEVDELTTTAINDDYVWIGGSSSEAPAATSAFGSGYLYNGNTAKSVDNNAQIMVNGTLRGTYDYTGADDYVGLKLADGLVGKILVYYIDGTTGATATTMHSSSPTGVEVGTQIIAAGTKVVSYTFTATDPRSYYVTGGKIAAIEVLAQHTAEYAAADLMAFSPSLIGTATFSWTFDDENVLGTTINNGTTEMVLNGTQYITGGGNKLQYIMGSDLVINDTQVSGHGTRSVIFDNTHAQGFKLQGGKKYTINAWWAKCADEVEGSRPGGLALFQNPTYNGYTNRVKIHTSSSPLTYTVDLSTTEEDQVFWIAGYDQYPVYYSGFTVEEVYDNGIVVDVRQPGIFTGKWQTAEDNGEDQLLIYCTDNGSTESFRVPKVYFHNGQTGANTDITPLEYTVDNFERVSPANFAVAGATNNSQPYIGLDTAEGMDGTYRVYGFEDTDNDRVYRVNYSYTHNGTTYKYHYYLWFANYLKIGWWTNRDAKLIVGTNNSYDDPDNIIVGEFYVSSGSSGNFYYDVINTGKDKDNNIVDGYASSLYTGSSWTYTGDKQTVTSSKSLGYDSTKREKKADGETPEEFSWTKMNDHKNHLTDYTIEMKFPMNYNEEDWSNTNGEVVKTVTYKAHRANWPDWTVKLVFHFVRAPKIELASSSNTLKSVKMTGYKGAKDEVADASATIYYTTDGTTPTFDFTTTPPTPTNATYTYNDSDKPSNTHSAIYYAAEVVKTPQQFYVVNPYTTHIEGQTPATLMQSASNKSNNFVSMSGEFSDAWLHDPMVEYVDDARNIVRTDAAGNTTDSGISALGRGGDLYSYPFGSSARDMMVQFGNSSIYSYREKVFKHVGVYWTKDENDSFVEHLDWRTYTRKTVGQNMEKKYDATYTGASQNGNPHTECNGGLGGANTEDGGKWLQPITGDFLRFEPEYDGVITVWMRHNGAGQGNEEKGNITRRPVYVVDENGKVMKRSTVKPSSEHYFGIDGTYAEINSNKSTVRHDCRTDWVNGLTNWKSGYDGDKGLEARYMATFRLYNYWYGFQLYQNKNAEKHGGSAWQTYRYSMDVPDSWISRTAYVQSVQCQFNSIVYHSDHLHNDIEKSQTIVYTNGDGGTGNIISGDKFAKYGYELPAFNNVRYRIPVKAGKTYYIGGRGTKNGYIGTKFEPLPANYDHADYVHADNRVIDETTNSYVAAPLSTASLTQGSQASATYDKATSTTVKNGYSTLETKHLYEDASHNNNWLKDYTINDFGNAMVGTTVNVQVHRTFTKGYWHPIVLPFSVSETKLKEVLGDDVQVLYLDPYDHAMKSRNGGVGQGGDWVSAVYPAITSSSLRFTHHHYQMLYANTPAFVRPGGQINGEDFTEVENPTFYRVTIEKSNLNGQKDTTLGDFAGIGYCIGKVGNHEYWVVGSYNYTADAGEIYYINNSDGKASVHHSLGSNARTMKGMRCWIEPRSTSTGGGKPPYLCEVGFSTFDGEDLDVDNMTSGIQDIVMDDTVIDMYDNDNVYDLMGRVVAVGSTAGLPSGIYIHHGQKIYIR